LAAGDPKKELCSTMLLKHDMYTLTICKCKPSRNVVLLSSMHQSVDIGNDATKRPETITFYNATKFGVDVVDQMA
jgi:CO dehydrogenase/acetyl-CoA synthase gamma subunit (corrinoid Fe-S protein)